MSEKIELTAFGSLWSAITAPSPSWHRPRNGPSTAYYMVVKKAAKVILASRARSAAAGDILRQHGKQQTERRVTKNNFAADDNLTDQRRRPHVSEAQCRVSHNREVVRGEPRVGAVFVVEDMGKDSIDR